MTNSTSASDDLDNKQVPTQVSQGGEPESYHALLKAAITQFAQKGFDGTRIETVAKEAHFNKSLVYRHFGDKEGLFKAALRHKLDERIRMLPESPLILADVMYNYFTETIRDREYIRLIVGEALHRDADAVVDEDWRHEYYRKHVATVQEAQRQGKLPDSIEPAFLMLLITSMVVFPAAFPQIARMLTGYNPDSPEFQERWKEATMGLEAAMRLAITANQDQS